MRHTVQMVEQAPVNNALLNVVTPMGLSFEKNRLSIGENIGKAYGIIRYPQKVDVEWLSKLTNIPSTLVSIGFKPVDNGTLINEPTSSLDPLEEKRQFETAFKLLKDKTVIIITHRVGITNYADRILFMDDGKIVEEGTQEQLLNRRGKFYELYDSQRKWY